MREIVHIGDILVATPYPDLHRTTIVARQPDAVVWNIQVHAGELLLAAATPTPYDAILKVLRNGQLIEVLRADVTMPGCASR